MKDDKQHAGAVAAASRELNFHQHYVRFKREGRQKEAERGAGNLLEDCLN